MRKQCSAFALYSPVVPGNARGLLFMNIRIAYDHTCNLDHFLEHSFRYFGQISRQEDMLVGKTRL